MVGATGIRHEPLHVKEVLFRFYAPFRSGLIGSKLRQAEGALRRQLSLFRQ